MKTADLKEGMKLPYKELPNETMFFAGGYLCQKLSQKKAFIFQTYNETDITDPDAIVEVTGTSKK